VCRIAAQHDPAGDQSLGDGDVHPPQADTADLDLKVGHADCSADPLLDAVGVPCFASPLVGLHGDLAQPAPACVQRLQHAGGSRIGYEQQDACAVPHVGLDVGPEVTVDEVVDALFAFQRDAELASDKAIDSVRRDQCRPGQVVRLAGVYHLHLHGGLGVGLTPARNHLGDLVAEPQVDHARHVGRVAQYRLDQLLRRHHRQRRTHTGSRPFEPLRLDLTELCADHGVEESDRTLPARRSVNSTQTLVDQPAPAPGDLHCASVEVARFRVP